jgi:hypothetical protein
MPVILVIQEAEIRRIVVQSQSWAKKKKKKKKQDPIPKIPNTKKGWFSGSSGTVPA